MLNFTNLQFVSGLNIMANKQKIQLSELLRQARISVCLRTLESKNCNVDKWLAIIKYNGKSIAVNFAVQKGSNIIPTGADAIQILINTSIDVDRYRSFHEWARALGVEYDLGAREAYNVQKEKSKEARAFFGEAKFNELAGAEHSIFENRY